jgi:DNA-binding transcriptional MerR regulator
MIDPKQRLYKPSEVVTLIGEHFGQILTPAVIRKWDYEVLAEFVDSREPMEKRLYSKHEVDCFLLIAVLRSLGFGLKEIKRKMEAMFKNHGDGLDIEKIKSRMDRQRVGFDKVYSFLLKKHEQGEQVAS